MRLITKSANLFLARSNPRTCHLKPLSTSAKGTISLLERPLVKERYRIEIDFSRKIALVICASVPRSGQFNFAGAWSTLKDKSFFETYVKEHNLESVIKYHGLVSGEKKSNLFKTSNVFVFPTSYSKEVFPLSILEALSYGLPVLTFSKGAIPEIINEDVGIITNKEKINKDFNTIVECYLNEAAYNSCRNSFLINYTNKVFEKKLVTILKQKTLENC